MDNDDTLVGLYLGNGKRGHGRIRNYAQGDVIISSGDAVDHILMALSGTVISLRTKNGRAFIRRHTASTVNGEEVAAFIGVAAFITRKPSIRSYSAACDCIVVSLDAPKLLDVYNDGNALPLVRDMIRNSDSEVSRALLAPIRKAFEKNPTPGMNPEDPENIFRIPNGSSRTEAERLDKVYRTLASKILYSILEKYKNAAGGENATLVETPVHHAENHTLPPPPPGSGAARKAWEAARKNS